MAVRQCIPSLDHAPTTREVVTRLQAIVDRLGLRLDRFELVYDDADGDLASEAYWVVADLPPHVGFAHLGEARLMLSEQLHVRAPDGEPTDADAFALEFLLSLVEHGLEGERPPMRICAGSTFASAQRREHR